MGVPPMSSTAVPAVSTTGILLVNALEFMGGSLGYLRFFVR